MWAEELWDAEASAAVAGASVEASAGASAVPFAEG